MKKFEVFTRTIPWYEQNPSKKFIYLDKQTKLWFAIYVTAGRQEFQGAAYDKCTAWHRLDREAQKKGIYIPSLDSFDEYDKLDRVVSYKVSY